MSGPLKNARHERFVQELFKGRTLGKAYVLAGYKQNDKNAARLKKYEGVAARLAELQGRTAQRAEVTVETIHAMLMEDRELARKNGQPSAAVSAALGIAKIFGLIIDKSRVQHENLVPDLSGLTEKERIQFERLLAKITFRPASTSAEQAPGSGAEDGRAAAS